MRLDFYTAPTVSPNSITEIDSTVPTYTLLIFGSLICSRNTSRAISLKVLSKYDLIKKIMPPVYNHLVNSRSEVEYTSTHIYTSRLATIEKERKIVYVNVRHT